MKKLILASAAVIVLSTGYANAGGIILGSDENDRKVWVNTWAGQTADKKLGRYGSSVSTFSGGKTSGGIILGSDENDRKVWINKWAGQSEDEVSARRYGSSVSTFSDRRSPGASIRGMHKNTHEVWVRR